MTHVFISGLFMLLYQIQAIKEYLWIANKKVVKSKQDNCGFTRISRIKTLKLLNLYSSTALAMEPARALLLDTNRGLTVPQTSAVWTTTATAAQNNFLEQSSFPKVQYYNFLKKCFHNCEIKDDWENKVQRHLLELVNTLQNLL